MKVKASALAFEHALTERTKTPPISEPWPKPADFSQWSSSFSFSHSGASRQRPQLDKNLSHSGSGCGKPNGRDSHGGRGRGPRRSRTSRPQIQRARNVRFYQLRVRTSRTFCQRQGYDFIFNTEVNSSTWEA